MPLLDVEEYPDACTRGHSSPLDAVRIVARSAEQVEENPFAPDPLAPVWIDADDVTCIATSLPDGSLFASPATLVQCDDPKGLSYPRDPTIEGQDLDG